MKQEMKKKRATMKEVAKQAGVTIGTVSHVINGTASISEQTIQKVKKAIKDLDYVPNAVAQNMRIKENRIIGLLIPKLSNIFYSRIASVVMDEADKEEYTVLIVSYEYSLKKEERELYSLLKNNVGTIIVINGMGDEELLQNLLKRGINVILADRRTDLEQVSYVEYDNITVMSDVVALLKEKGYQRIGYISEPLDLTNLQDRFEGYKCALKKYGYVFDSKNVFVSDSFRRDHMGQGYLFMKNLLDTKKKEELPDVFVVSSDLLAMGVLKGMMEKGYLVPRDFGIVGCDDLEISPYIHPALTTIRQDREQLGRTLWDLAKMSHEGKRSKSIKLSQELIVRESC